MSYVGERGAKALGDVQKTNTTLTSLDLKSNETIKYSDTLRQKKLTTLLFQTGNHGITDKTQKELGIDV